MVDCYVAFVHGDITRVAEYKRAGIWDEYDARVHYEEAYNKAMNLESLDFVHCLFRLLEQRGIRLLNSANSIRKLEDDHVKYTVIVFKNKQ